MSWSLSLPFHPTKVQKTIQPMAEAPVESTRVLVVSRDSSLLRPLWSLGESNSWQLETASSGWEAMELVQSEINPHLLLLDLPRGDGDSLHLLRWLRRLHPELPVIVACHPDDATQPQEAMRLGAEEVVMRPLDNQRLESAISKHVCSANGKRERHISGEDIERLGEDEFFLSASPAMQKLRAQAELLAQADVPVLILGEPGSGKTTIARLIHQLSVHSGFRFRRLHCGKTPAELLEAELFGKTNGAANGSGKNVRGALPGGEKGTLLLEEISEMPLALQARLVEGLQNHNSHANENGNGKFDVRILASSSAKLDRAIAEHRLREDLYYRLSAFIVHVPALRQRKEEIKVLLQYAMHKFARHYGLIPREFTPQLLEACARHTWPGNLQELETFVKRYLVAGDHQLAISWLENASTETIASKRFDTPQRQVEASDSDVNTKSLKSLIQSVKSEAEKNAIAAALEKTGWNRKAAARLLKVSYRTMLYKIDEYDINPAEHYTPSYSGTRAANRGNGKGF
jgi:two-component system, NtrC family, response regulator AtoC